MSTDTIARALALSTGATGQSTIATAAAVVATTQAGIASTAALTPALLVQTNSATPTTPPSGSSSGGQYWAVDATNLNLLLYLNTSGVGAPTAVAVSVPTTAGLAGSVAATRSALMRSA